MTDTDEYDEDIEECGPSCTEDTLCQKCFLWNVGNMFDDPTMYAISVRQFLKKNESRFCYLNGGHSLLDGWIDEDALEENERIRAVLGDAE